jgi:predicted MPP superfamily phosphohydrolase
MGYKPCIKVIRKIVRGLGLGVGDIDVHGEVLKLPAWPESLDGLRVTVIADLHAGSPQFDEQRIAAIVARVKREQVDLVALVGDYIDPGVALGEWIQPETIAAHLARLRSRLGSVAVLGNHDWGHAGARMPAALAAEGIRVLENEAIRLDATRSDAGAAGSLWIAGVADLMQREPDLDATLAPIPPDAPVILLSHNPDLFPKVPERVALTLSGHTHGAQVDIPLLRDRVTPSKYGAHYTGGHIVEHGRHLYVSDGIGTSRLPIRFRAEPEIPVLELRAWNSASP